MKSGKRDSILEYLMSINGFVSGEELGRIAHCSPQNVSYHIEISRKNGIDIEVSHRGYRYMRENENELIRIKDRLKDMNILFEYIRSCIDLRSIRPSVDRRGIYYTYSEIDFFCKNSQGNISFLADILKDGGVLPLLTGFFSDYLNEEVSVLKADEYNYLTCDSFIFGRHTSKDKRDHFQIVLNICGGENIEGRKVIPLSKVKGDYIGVKGFSVLIFDYLCVNLRSG